MTVSPLRCACAIGALLGASAIGAAPEKIITILHTNDLHGQVEAWHGWEGELAGKTIGGMDHLATAIKQARAEGSSNLLLLDAGDAIPRRKVGGMIQVSGLRFTHDSKRVTEVQIGEAALDPARRYLVATNSMLADGGHNYATFREGEERAENGSQFQIIADWIRQQKKVAAPADVRSRSISE